MAIRVLVLVIILASFLSPEASAQQVGPGQAARSQSAATRPPAQSRRTADAIPYSQYAAPVDVAASGWTTVVRETFEGTWPSGSWTTFDNDGATNGDYCWNDVAFQGFQSVKSAWPAAGCANALSPSPSTFYPDNADSWMVYGPFSLVGAQAAYVSIKAWTQMVGTGDTVGVYASTNDLNYSGVVVTGTSFFGDPPSTLGWSDIVLDLAAVPTLGNMLGRSQVWIAVIFASDGSQADNGPFVDEVVVAKRTTPTSTIGGRNLKLKAGPPGSARLAWDTGTATGYIVLRWSPVQGFRFFPSNLVPLSASTSSFTDTEVLVDEAYCYLVLPVGGSPPSINNVLALSDFLCLYTDSAFGTPPADFQLELRQSDIARVSWSSQVNAAAYLISFVTFDNAPGTGITLNSTRASYEHQTGGKSTCYQVRSVNAAVDTIGDTTVLCAVPGLTSLKGAGSLGLVPG